MYGILHDEISQFTDQMVMNLADWETLPYDSFSPHQDIISSRLSTLYQLPTMQRGVLIVPVNTLMQRVCPHSFLHGHALVMKKGQRLSRDALRTQLDSAGANRKCIDLLMGHVSKDTGNRVYNHKTLDELKATVELIK